MVTQTLPFFSFLKGGTSLQLNVERMAGQLVLPPCPVLSRLDPQQFGHPPCILHVDLQSSPSTVSSWLLVLCVFLCLFFLAYLFLPSSVFCSSCGNPALFLSYRLLVLLSIGSSSFSGAPPSLLSRCNFTPKGATPLSSFRRVLIFPAVCLSGLVSFLVCLSVRRRSDLYVPGDEEEGGGQELTGRKC